MTSARTFLLAAGGHGRVVADTLRSRGMEVVGFLDPDAGKWGSTVDGLPVLGPEAYLDDVGTAGVLLANGIGNRPRFGDPGLGARTRAFVTLSAAGFRFATVVHPFTSVSPWARLEDGAQVLAGAVVQAGATVGRNTIVNTSASIDHDCHVEAHCHVAPGAVLCGGVRLGTGVHVGAGACILPSVAIGNGVVIAAGATVRADVPDGQTVTRQPPRS